MSAATVGGVNSERAATPIDTLADSFVTGMAALDPIGATSLGLPGHDHELPDFSPAGAEARATSQRELLAALADLEPADDVDAVTYADDVVRIDDGPPFLPCVDCGAHEHFTLPPRHGTVVGPLPLFDGTCGPFVPLP